MIESRRGEGCSALSARRSEVEQEEGDGDNGSDSKVRQRQSSIWRRAEYVKMDKARRSRASTDR